MTEFRHQIILSLCCLFLLAVPSMAQDTENAILTGLVTDVSENPVAGVEVFVYTNSNTRRPADFIAAPTKDDGIYRITVPPGTYWVVARLRKGDERFGPLLAGDKHSGTPLEVEFFPGETVEEDFVVVDLEESSQLIKKYDTSFYEIEGILLSKNGEPLADAFAFANREAVMKKIPDYISAWTDTSGRYTLFLPEGTYYFGVSHEFPIVSGPVKLKKVTIDSDQKNNNIVFEK